MIHAPALCVDLGAASDAVHDAALIGGKARNLQRLGALGLPVPPGACVTTEALSRVVVDAELTPLCRQAALELARGDGERARRAGHAVAQALRTAPIPADVQRAVAGAWARLLAASDPGGRGVSFAVRSSALGEDAGDRSHAGQFESVLQVEGLDATWDAIRQVWASWYSDRAITYRLQVRQAGQPHAGGLLDPIPPMAVILQTMVEPRASGILFSVNPVTGARRELCLEAGPGLGEELAQGRVLADYFVVRRGGTLGRSPGDQQLRVTQRGRAHDPPCVTDDEVLKLCSMALRVERSFGWPVDLEWALDLGGAPFLLQARPITALPPERRLAPTRGRDRPVLWTQRFSGERWTEQATPLGWSVVQPVLHWFIRWEDASERWLDGSEPTRLYRGRPYFNITIFRHLAFRLPGSAPPAFLLEMFPEEEQEELRRGSPYLPNLPLAASILGQMVREERWRRYHSNFLTNHREWETFRPGFEAAADRLPLDFTEPAEALPLIEQGQELMRQYLSIHLLSLLFAHLSYEALDKALRSWVGEGGEALRAALVTARGDNLTLRTNQALWDLAQEARRRPAVAARLLSGELPQLDELRAGPQGAGFGAAFDAFIAEFGHRSSASWEIFATRWGEDPDLVLRMVSGYLRGGMKGDPEQRERDRRRERAEAERLVRARMGRSRRRRALPWRQVLFGQLLEHTRSYMALRENQRFSFDRLLFRLKRIFERLGALLERDGSLAAGEDIVFLALPELRELCAGQLDPTEANQRVARRRGDFEANRFLAHPDFLQGPGEALERAARSGAALSGLGISPGRVEGTVRVLRSLDEMDSLRPGEILVARATDPGWTPLFLTAAGLVLELGSVLSHGAVVAREYGLPAVVNVEGATRVLRDGDRVVVDGDAGIVQLDRAQRRPIASERSVQAP